MSKKSHLTLNICSFRTKIMTCYFLHAFLLRTLCRWFRYCITCNVNMYLIFPNLPNGFETVTIKTLSLIIFVGLVWQMMFADDDMSESEFSVCVKI